MGDLEALLRQKPAEARQLLPLLQLIQAHYRYLPEEALRAVAKRLGLPLARVFGVATFYSALSLKPKGETVVRVCRGTACHLRGSEGLIAALEKDLGVKLGQTTADGRVTLEAVNCLGACALAPVIMAGETAHGHMTAAKAAQLVKAGGKPNDQ